MGKRQGKKAAGWSRIAIGLMLSVVTYLAGIFLVALLMVKGIVMPEKGGLILTAWAMVSAACGSLPVLKIKAATPLLAGLMQGGAFAVLILAASYLFWEGPVWSNTNIALLLCVLIGGLVPGALGSGGGRRKRKRGW